MPEKKNHLRAALVALADKLAQPFAGLTQPHRLRIAGACLAVSDLLSEEIIADVPEGKERRLVELKQFMAREMLGAVFCADLVASPETNDEFAQENLTKFVEWVAVSIHQVTSEAESLVAPPADAKGTMGLWRMNGVEGGKYLVLRRDGTTYEHPAFVLGARDPAAPAALHAYAEEAASLGFDAQYVADVRRLADVFAQYRAAHGDGDPDAKPHRVDDPATVARMVEQGRGA